LLVETLSEAMDRLQALGYELELVAQPGARLACQACGAAFDAAQLTIDETVRFEGASDPDDEAILFALSAPGGHLGLYSVAFGAATPADDVSVLQALPRQ
jgi:hypothetical protein